VRRHTGAKDPAQDLVADAAERQDVTEFVAALSDPIGK
jgi:hypothetical protein